jgi:SAM-dependent methyltransferase
MLRSMVCRYEHFLTPWYEAWARNFELYDPNFSHRKIWEWCVIAQALAERGMLGEGRRGCGFAVGKEPLVSLFASLGAEITATDLAVEQSEERWTITGDHARSLLDLYRPKLLDETTFSDRVTFRPADMRNLDDMKKEQFDFLWSSCAFEHLGNLQAGADFVVHAMDLLKPGGIAVHTTEYNVSSDDDTLVVGPDIIYRKRDLEDLGRRLRRHRCGMVPFDDDSGLHRYDLDYDVPPYYETGRQHVKLLFQDHVVTSCLLIIHKG